MVSPRFLRYLTAPQWISLQTKHQINTYSLQKTQMWNGKGSHNNLACFLIYRFNFQLVMRYFAYRFLGAEKYGNGSLNIAGGEA